MQFTYAVGDSHGCADKLKRLVTRCRAHANGRPIKFVFLGDYIDRGSHSREVIEFLIDLQSQMPAQVICIMGNHEELALAARHGGHYEEHWLRNGGDETLRSYGVTKAIELPVTHVTWIDSLPLQHDDGLRFFVHAGIDPNRPLNEQSPHDLLWIRGPFLADERVYERYIVHGHSPLLNRKPDQRANRLNLDTAAVLGGPLTAGVFDDKQIEPICFLQAN